MSMAEHDPRREEGNAMGRSSPPPETETTVRWEFARFGGSDTLHLVEQPDDVPMTLCGLDAEGHVRSMAVALHGTNEPCSRCVKSAESRRLWVPATYRWYVEGRRS